jgi:hypothetical protein
MSFWADSMQLRAPWAGLLGLLAPSRRPKKSRTHLNLPFPSIVKKRGPECRAPRACKPTSSTRQAARPSLGADAAHYLNDADGASQADWNESMLPRSIPVGIPNDMLQHSVAT